MLYTRIKKGAFITICTWQTLQATYWRSYQVTGGLEGPINDLRKLSMKETSEIVFSADVEVLYPNIPWTEGITAAIEFNAINISVVEEELKKERLLKPPTPAVFRECLELVVTENVFHFQERKWVRQLKGTAMGTSISVYFANTFIQKRTEHLINKPPRGTW